MDYQELAKMTKSASSDQEWSKNTDTESCSSIGPQSVDNPVTQALQIRMLEAENDDLRKKLHEKESVERKLKNELRNALAETEKALSKKKIKIEKLQQENQHLLVVISELETKMTHLHDNNRDVQNTYDKNRTRGPMSQLDFYEDLSGNLYPTEDFSLSTDLIEMEKSNTENRPFFLICPLCSKSYKNVNALKKHAEKCID